MTLSPEQWMVTVCSRLSPSPLGTMATVAGCTENDANGPVTETCHRGALSRQRDPSTVHTDQPRWFYLHPTGTHSIHLGGMTNRLQSTYPSDNLSSRYSRRIKEQGGDFCT